MYKKKHHEDEYGSKNLWTVSMPRKSPRSKAHTPAAKMAVMIRVSAYQLFLADSAYPPSRHPEHGEETQRDTALQGWFDRAHPAQAEESPSWARGHARNAKQADDLWQAPFDRRQHKLQTPVPTR